MEDSELLALIHRIDIETPGVPMVGLLRDEISTARYNARMLVIARALQAAERERCATLWGAERRGMNEWQPIATAPKNTAILGWFPELGCVVTSSCDCDKVNNAGGWAVGYDYYGPAPTHWQPLPPKPVDAGA